MKNLFQKAKKLKSLKASSGFTLLEVVFVIAIFAVMASIVLFRFNDFGARTAFDNLSQDIALRVVEARKSALAGKLNPNFDGTAAPSYGVYFSNDLVGDQNKQFIFFTDINSGGVFDNIYNPTAGCSGVSTVGNECISDTTITTGDYIDTICYESSGVFCNTSITPTKAHVTFIRPFPKATLVVESAGSTVFAQRLYIGLVSGFDSNIQKTIVIDGLGSVHVAEGGACTISGYLGGC